MLVFLKKIIMPKNWLATLVFIANGFFTVYLFCFLMAVLNVQLDSTITILIGVGLYLFSIVIALTPLGEWLCRSIFTTKTIHISKHPQYERLNGLFMEVYKKALKESPRLSRKVKLFIHKDDSINACAMGKSTIIINTGLLALSDEEIKGVIAHEFAHLANGDTLFSLAFCIGNFIFSAVLFAIKIIALFVNIIFSAVFDRDSLIMLVVLIALDIIFGLWNIIGNFIIKLTGRKAEYDADHYAGKIGYANQLKNALIKIEGEGIHFRMGLIEAINASHPDTCKRVERLEKNFPEQNKLTNVNPTAV